VDVAKLSKERQKLGQMQQQLDVLEDEKQKTASRANSLLSFLGIRSSSSSSSSGNNQGEQQQPAAAAAKPSFSGRQGLSPKLAADSSLQQQQLAAAAVRAVAVAVAAEMCWCKLGRALGSSC